MEKIRVFVSTQSIINNTYAVELTPEEYAKFAAPITNHECDILPAISELRNHESAKLWDEWWTEEAPVSFTDHDNITYTE
ncbi:hypothetical protein [Klebsiella phage phiKp_27]|nr:hypothetical protein [Klebsiella phage phiKp_27]